MKIIFLKIKKKLDKILKITNSAKYYFENKKKLLFLVKDEKAFQFLSDLLWKEPRFSFIPHSKDFKKDFIVISQTIPLPATNIFNLASKPIEKVQFTTIYEFEDFSSKEKIKISKEKFKFYKNKNYQILSK